MIFGQEKNPLYWFIFVTIISLQLFFLILFAEAQEINSEAYNYYKKGLKAGSLSEKIENFQKAVELDSSFKQALYYLGITYYQKSNYSHAIEYLKKAVRLDSSLIQKVLPYLLNAYNFLAAALIENENYEDALKAAQNAINLDKNFKPAYVTLGLAFYNLRAWHDSIKAFEKSIALGSSQVLVWNKLGNLFLRVGEYDKSIKAYEKALLLDPNLKEVQKNLKIAEKRNSLDSWLERFEDAALEGQWDKAIEILRKAQFLYPESSKIENRLRDAILEKEYFNGLQAFEEENWAEAVKIFQKLDPNYKDTLMKLKKANSYLENETKSREQQLIGLQKPTNGDENKLITKNFSSVKQNSSKFSQLPQTTKPSVHSLPDKPTLSSEIVKSQDQDTWKIKSQGKNSWVWILGIFGGVLIVSLVLFGFIKIHTHHDATEIVNTSENPEELQETKTILGGIKQIKRIGRYIIEKEIGKGSMGLVYKAWDPKLDRTVVIKQVVFDLRGEEEIKNLKDRLFREARAAGRLNHPNIVIIYDVGEAETFSYIVMEYLSGKDLKYLLEREGKFELNRSIHIIRQIGSALDFAHKCGIIHRDIKPSNFILTGNDNVKVVDFGIAQIPQFGTLTQTGDVIGTPYYMSPEQIEGRKVNGRSDIFSLGVVFYEMVTGIRPFEGETIPSVVYKIVHNDPPPPSSQCQGLPKYLDEIIRKLLAKNSKDRYATAAELLLDLERW